MTAPREAGLAAGPEDWVADLFDAVPYALAALDASGRIVRRNAALAALGGGGVESGTALFDAADRGLLAARLLGPCAAGARAGPVTLRLAGGAAVEVFAAPWQAAGAAGVLLTLRDLRLQVRLEAELASRQRLQAAGQMAAGLAHDFNNLLTVIGGAAEALGARAASRMDGESTEDAAEIGAAVARGATLVRQLLAFARQQALTLAPLPANAAIRALAPLLQRLLGPMVRLCLELDPAEPFVLADAGPFDQVLVNLAANAKDAMPHGGTLTIRSFGARFHRPLRHMHETIPPGDYVAVEVEDSGCGMSPEVLARLFEPFFTTKREAGGTGLGLAMVQGSLRQSNGFVVADSAPGKGTRLRLYWLRAAGAAVAAAPAPAAPPAAAGAGTVLLVDDEDSVRRVAARALAVAGWRVLQAGSGAEAMEVLRSERPALLMSDVAMPGMDGLALAEAARRYWPDLPVLLMSGYADAATRAGAAGPGMALVLKPCRMADLLERAAALVRDSAGTL